MNRPILATFMFCLVLSAGILVLSYRPEQKPEIKTSPVDTSFSGWWTKTRNSEEHRKAIKESTQ